MRLFVFVVIACVVVFALALNFFPAFADASGPVAPPSTHILQNRDEQDRRVSNRNGLLYDNGATTNTNSDISTAPPPSTQVPSGSAVTDQTPAPDQGSSTGKGSVSADQEADLQALLPTPANDLPAHKLTRTQAIAQALSQNYDIRIKAYDEEAAQALLRQAHGAFDPVFHAEGSYEDIRDPQNTQDFVATGGIPQDILDGQPRIFVENNEHYKIALDGKLETGLQYEVKSQLDVLSNTLNRTSPLSLFTPEYQSFTGVTIDQPFLRGFGTDVNNSEIRAAIVNKMAVRYDVEDQMLNTVSQVLQSYFQLSYLTQELEAKRQDRDLGVKLVQERFKGLERGEVSSREVNRSESTLAEIIEDYTKAQNEVINQQTVMQALISSDLGQISQFIYVPTTHMTAPELHMTVDQLITMALIHRPKYLEAQAKVQEQNIKLVYAENQTWPQLDLKGTYGVNGLSGSFGNSYYREIIPQGPQWSVGLAFSVPIGNNDAEGKYDEIKARKKQALLDMKQIELDTSLLVRKLVATFRSDENRLKAMNVFADTAHDNFQDEQVRLEKGLSTDLDVLKYRRDSTEAEARRLAALADLNSVYIQLQQTTGMLLSDLNIQVTD